MILRNADGSVSAGLAHNENDRLEYLDKTQLLDSHKEEVFDLITRLACTWLNMPMAAISLVDKDRQWFKAKCGLSAKETSRDMAFCAHTILEQLGMVIPDTLEDSRFSDNPLVKCEPFIRFYAGAPIIIPDGLVLGTLCVIDSKPHQEFTKEHFKTLEDLAAIVSHIIETRVTLMHRL